jgi:mono/diheme cytochrome c family protein
MNRNWMLLFCLAVMTFLVGTAIAQERAKTETTSKASPDAPILTANSSPTDDDAPSQRTQRSRRTRQARHTTKSERTERAEGEQRFRENCGRCHQPPHKFPPRVMAAAIRHMRVRAMLTDEDMRLILQYMTQ